MQRKKAFLISAIAALMSLNQAVAYSPYSAEGNKFELKSVDGNYKIGIGGLLNPILEIEHRRATDSTEFDVKLNRARIRLYGNAFDPALTYLFQVRYDHAPLTLETAPNTAGVGQLLDYSVSWAWHQEYLHLAVGKFAIPFARQQVIPAAKSQFMQSSMVDNYFQITPFNRDIGIMLHNGYNNRFEYALSLVKSGVGARVGYNHNPGELDAYDAVDWQGGNVRFGLGASAFLSTDYKSKVGNFLGSVDYIVKVHGFSSNGAFYYKRFMEQKVNHLGAVVDAGYLINDRWEPVFRYGWANVGGHEHQIMAGLNHYYFGHNLKGEIFISTRIKENNLENFVGGIGLQLAI